MTRQTARTWLRRQLAATGVCAVIAVISGMLQGALAAAGDLDGASAVRGVLLVATTGLVLSLVGQVVILSIIEACRDD